MNPSSQTGYIVRLVYVAGGMLVAVLFFGSIGYMVLTEGKYSWFDCFYMTFITITTIGFGEIIDMSGNQPARVLTVIIGILGAGNLSLLFSVVTVASVSYTHLDVYKRQTTTTVTTTAKSKTVAED